MSEVKVENKISKPLTPSIDYVDSGEGLFKLKTNPSQSNQEEIKDNGMIDIIITSLELKSSESHQCSKDLKDR